MSPAPPISVIVPLSGPPTQALRCLEAIAGQPEEPAFEVIVVDDASVGLEALLSGLEGDVTVLRTARRVGFAAAAALGAQRASGEVMALLRDGAEPRPGWLASLLKALEDPSAGLACSVTAPERDTHPLAAWSAATRTRDLRDAGLPDLPGPLAIGGLALRLAERGLRTVAAPDSVVAAPGARTGGARRAPGESAELTVVIPTLDAASSRVASCIAAVQATTDVPHQIVIVDNGAPPQGFTAPVNAGLRAARTPYVVVMNDDVEPLGGWWQPLRTALDAGAPVAFPLTVDGPMRRDFAAWCFGMTRAAVEAFGYEPGEFFDPGLVVWYQDTDLLHRLRAAGRPPVLVESAHIRHGLSETVGTEDPVLSAWIRTQVGADRDAFLRKHPDVALQAAAFAGK